PAIHENVPRVELVSRSESHAGPKLLGANVIVHLRTLARKYSAMEFPVDLRTEGATAAAKPRRVRRTILLVVGLLLVLITVAVVVRRQFWSSEDLPDVGDPFDVAEVHRLVNIPDADNAFVAYAAAHHKLGAFNSVIANVDFGSLGWSNAAPAVREFLE